MFRFKGVPFFLMFLVALPVLIWFFLPQKTMDIIVLNKTVPDTSYQEHRGLFWILSHDRYRKGDGSPYQFHTDYYGYHPREGVPVIQPLPSDLTSKDLIYIADTYGVYEDDFATPPRGERSPLIYGGVIREEIEAIREALYAGATLVAEFNTFGTPTPQREREQLYHLLGLEWKGWMGRYFHSLSQGQEVPPWAVTNYEAQYRRPWAYEGSGFLLVHEDDQVVILEHNRHTTSRGVRFHFTKEGQKILGLTRGATYNYWFDIIHPFPDTSVLACYEMDLTPAGEHLLQEMGIPLYFPAVVKNSTRHYDTYYFAGDYADYEGVSSIHHLAFWDQFRRYFSLDHAGNRNAFYWRVYVPIMKNILARIQEREEREELLKPVVYQDGEISLCARVHQKRMQVYRDGDWVDFPIKGVNLGTALPGYWFTQFPEREWDYRRWLEKMGALEANTLRVYTLLNPAFYRALYQYNLENPQKPLYLLQEIWPEEHPENDDLLGEEYLKAFLTEIAYVVDAIHGQIHIPEREYRAHGRYYVDVSPYLLGYLVGREFEPDEVLATDTLNEGFFFQGKYFQTTKESTPTENWVALTADYLLSYQEETYQWQHPVAMVSWPPLDPMEHDSEWNEEGDKSKQYNDMVSMDIRNILAQDSVVAGFFGAYHIYPNYPDFINNEPAYDAYHDGEGRFRYGGYLQHLMEYHGEIGALVAEFGLATGMGNAHHSPDGYHHGGLTEVEQGEGIVRMMKAIFQEGYMGGVIFAWMDEWAKKTWTTEPFMIPYERHIYWHNAMDPEQNYGILAVETIRPEEAALSIPGEGWISGLEFRANEAFFFLDISFQEPLDLHQKTLLIGLDTYDRQQGEFLYGKDLPLEAPSGMEFLVQLERGEGRLLVTPDYNASLYRFSSRKRWSGIFQEITPLINRGVVTRDGTIIKPLYEEGSLLLEGDFEGYTHHWYMEGKTLFLRLPWGRIQVTDPSRGLVLDDDRINEMTEERDNFQVTETEGFIVSVVLLQEEEILAVFPPPSQTPTPFLWEGWDVPIYQERWKTSFPIIRDYFKELDHFPEEEGNREVDNHGR